MHMRNSAGETLLHVAARHGRNDAMWHLVCMYPHFAAEFNDALQLPEELCSTSYGYTLCRTVRKWYLRDYAAV